MSFLPNEEFLLLKQETAISSRMRLVSQQKTLHPHHHHHHHHHHYHHHHHHHHHHHYHYPVHHHHPALVEMRRRDVIYLGLKVDIKLWLLVTKMSQKMAQL